MKLSAITFSLVSIACSSVYAAVLVGPRRGCGNDIAQSEFQALELEYQAKLSASGIYKYTKEDLRTTNADPTNEPTNVPGITIPTWWHIITKTNTTTGVVVGDYTQAQIDAQMKVMNDAFTGRFTFDLVGITKTDNITWFESVAPSTALQTAMKNTLRRGDATTLNMYTVGFEKGTGVGLLGYATFPSSFAARPRDDGVVFLHSSIPGGSAAPYNGGQTLTHEVGHWLGLFHSTYHLNITIFLFNYDRPPKKEKEEKICVGSG
jgi:hypothetical protein